MALPLAERTGAPSPFNQDSDSDVVLISSDNVVFYCHKLLLGLVSPVFKTMFTLPVGESKDVYDGRPCVVLTEEANSLSLLLSWCDPRCTTRSTTIAELEKVLELADKYGMESIMKLVKNFMITSIDVRISNPIQLFAIAVRFRLDDLARMAAEQALDKSLEDLITLTRFPAAKHLSAYCLQNLLQYHINCSREAARAAIEFEWLERHRSLKKVSPFTTLPVQCDDAECGIVLMIVGSRSPDHQWLSWWLEYMKLAAEALTRRPTACAITCSQFLEEVHATISAINCTPCRKIVQDSFFPFNEFLAKEIRKRIKKETFTLEY